MQTRPFLTTATAVERTRLTAPTVNSCLDILRRMGVVKEITGRKRDRVYAYQAYVDLLSDGAAPPAADQ